MSSPWWWWGSCLTREEAAMEDRKKIVSKRKESLEGRRVLLENKIREIDGERSRYKESAAEFLRNGERGRAALELNKYDNAALNVARFSKFHASVCRLLGMLDRFLFSEDLMHEFGGMRAEVKMIRESVAAKEGAATDGDRTDELQDEIFDAEGLFDHLDKQVAELSSSPLGIEDYDVLTEDQGERLRQFERELRGEEEDERARVVPPAVASAGAPAATASKREGAAAGAGGASPFSPSPAEGAGAGAGARKKPRPPAKVAALVVDEREKKRAEERRVAATLFD